MKKQRHYITAQLIFIPVEQDENGFHDAEFSEDMMSFNANVYTNTMYHNSTDRLCGYKVKDNVSVTIPANTLSIVF